jgi:hypothetical protein
MLRNSQIKHRHRCIGDFSRSGLCQIGVHDARVYLAFISVLLRERSKLIRLFFLARVGCWSATVFALALLGCASPEGNRKNFVAESLHFYQAGNFEKSYRALEDALGSPDAATRLSAYDFIVAHPDVRLAAVRTFEPAALQSTFATYEPSGALSVEQVRLAWYSKFASDDEIDRATANIDSAHSKARNARAGLDAARQNQTQMLLVNELVFLQLRAADRESVSARQPSMQVIPVQAVGRLISHQVIDRSKPASNAGSQLGGAVGQAAYVDQSFRQRNYSAVGQLSAGLIGALVGSSLNRPAETKFLISYGIETMDGSVKAFITSSTNGVAAPNGQCVYAGDAMEAPNFLCADTLVGFLQRAKKFNSGGKASEIEEVSDRISCKISTVGAISLSRDDCSKLGGKAGD